MENGLTKPQKTLLLCSALIAGAGAALEAFNGYLSVALIILLIFLSFFVFKKFLSLRFAVLVLVIFILSVFYTDFRTPSPDDLFLIAPKDLSMRGKVISPPRHDLKKKTKFYFRVNELKYNGKWLPAKAKTIVYIYDKYRKFDNIKIGDILELKGSVNPPYKATNPGEFDYGKYLNRKGIFTMTFVRYDNYKIIGNSGYNTEFFLHKLNNIRNNILDVHRQYLDSPKIELLGGMVFGDHAVPVPENIEKSFIKSGLLHLLAASGLNVGIIFGIWFFIASRVGVPFRAKIIAGMLLVGIYSLLTGLPPSVTRATLMLEFVLIGKLLDRQADNATLLVIVGVLMLLFNPLMMVDVSFQLSFVVTLGLLMFVPLLVKKTKPVPEFLSGAFWVPFVAQLFVTPIQAFHFNTFAPYSVLANMLVIPFVGFISFSGFAGSIFALIPWIGEKICFIADKIAEPFISLLLLVSDFTASLPEALIYLPQPTVFQIITFYALLFVIFMSLRNNFSFKRYNIPASILLLTLVILIFKGNFVSDRKLEFVFFDVGEGDSVLIKTPEKRYFLVDTGPSGKYSPARIAILPYLRDNGIKKLDYILLTHPDSDHTGGTTDILGEIKVGKLLHNGVRRETKNFLSVQESLRQNNIKAEVLSHNDTIEVDKNLRISVIRLDDTDLSNDNEDSLVLYIVYKDFSALLMADCEAESVDILKKIVKPPVNLLKVGHHGSYNSVNEQFMNYIKPDIAVISVGKRGYHQKHPHPQVLKLLKDYKSKIFRTDLDHTIKIITDGYNIDYWTYKQHKKTKLWTFGSG